MHLTQNLIPSVVAELNTKGVMQFVLSSRGPDMRESSIRELNRNGLSFDFTKDNSTSVATYLPYDLNSPESACLQAEDVTRLKLGVPRLISYGNGVMLSSGQHKGAMLRSFLCGLQKRIDAIVFVDDKQKNVDAVDAAYVGLKVDVTTYRYGEEDEKVKAFHAGDKAQAKSDWILFKSLIDKIFAQ